MTTRKRTLRKLHIGLLWAALLPSAGLMQSCSGSGLTPTEPDNRRGAKIMFGSPANVQEYAWQNGRESSRTGVGGSYTRACEYAHTRAGEIDSDIPDNIGVFAFGDGPNTTYIFRNQKVLYRHGEEYLDDQFDWDYPENPVDVWPYTTETDGSVQRPWEKMRYRFFAYSPWFPTSNVTVTAENYGGFNSFTWDNIPGFSANDFVLCNEIVDVDNREGNFTSLGNVIHFRMRHILSRLRFFFKVSKEYHQVRRIELNKVTVVTAGRVKSATFNFRNDAWDETVHWSNEQPGNAKEVELTSRDEEPYFIPVDYPAAPFASVYVYPQDKFKEIKLDLDYTVYDSQGVATRHAHLVSAVALPDWTLLSGYYYDIRISIAPDYMYVLSDNDQTFDGYVIIKDTTTPQPTE